MCGICGEIFFSDIKASERRLQDMTETMARRGPDGSGIFVRGPVGFGHRRLMVIDPAAAGAQPFVIEELGLSLVFNGCIYNYPQLRQELQGLGHSFRSTSDTEVILRAWSQWGPATVDRLIGMFAFAVHDWTTGSVTLVRDRFGIKPLYYAEVPGGLRFA